MFSQKLIAGIMISQLAFPASSLAAPSTQKPDIDLPPLPTSITQEEKVPASSLKNQNDSNLPAKKVEAGKEDQHDAMDDKEIDNQVEQLTNRLNSSETKNNVILPEVKEGTNSNNKSPSNATPALPKNPSEKVEKADQPKVNGVTPKLPAAEQKLPTLPVQDNKAKDNPAKKDTLIPPATNKPNIGSIPPPPPPPTDSSPALAKEESTTPESNIEQKLKMSGAGSEDLKFISDEAKVLMLPNDDVVLGKMTVDAKIEQMDFNNYVGLYRKIVSSLDSLDKLQEINKFLATYDKKYNKVDPLEGRAKDEAFYLVSKGDVFTLKNLIDHYPILQAKNDQGNTMLQFAVESENYRLVKYLLIRGININAINSSDETAYIIADHLQNEQIKNILIKAGVKY
jgi:hypothetical protein